MADTLDILVVESHHHAADEAIAALEAAGHRVHRCHDAGDRSFPCVGLTGAACPIDEGVDVALLVRQHVSPRPTPLEDVVRCAVRAGVPLVEQGPDVFDPFEPWVLERADRDVVAACVRATGRQFDQLRDEVMARISTVVLAAGVAPASIDCHIESDGPRLNVSLIGPLVDLRFQQALGVRVLDAIRTARRTYGEVNVSYRTARA
jgi:hypothetical protein